MCTFFFVQEKVPSGKEEALAAVSSNMMSKADDGIPDAGNPDDLNFI